VTYPVERVDALARATVGSGQRLVAVGPMGYAPPVKVMSAYWDDRRGMGKAVDYLAGLGHRHVAFLAGCAARYKERAFAEAAGELGMEVSTVDVADETDQLAAGADMARRVLELDPRPTAIVARNDQFAIGAISALHAAGVRIPEDISLVGYNDTPMAAYTTPSLTTVRTPVVECAEAVLDSALRSLQDPSDQDQPQVHSYGFDTRLIVRDSVGPPRAG